MEKHIMSSELEADNTKTFTSELNRDEIIISIIKEIEGSSREISLRMSYDNRKVFVENVWVTELLLDGQQVDVPAHTYAEQIAVTTTDFTAIARYSADLIHSKGMVQDLRACLKIQPDLTIGIGLHI